jgi:hypothetical protein
VKRGRPPKPAPEGVVRIERDRHEIRYWKADWPEEQGPTFVVVKKPSKKSPGRPKASIEDQRKLLRLRIATAAHEARGAKLEAAILAAMSDLDWPDRSAAELERIRTRFRRARRKSNENDKGESSVD